MPEESQSAFAALPRSLEDLFNLALGSVQKNVRLGLGIYKGPENVRSVERYPKRTRAARVQTLTFGNVPKSRRCFLFRRHDRPELHGFGYKVIGHSILILCGPTGSGKTTTIYSILRAVDAVKNNVLTAESPIEVVLENISQTQVDDEGPYSFAMWAQGILRQAA